MDTVGNIQILMIQELHIYLFEVRIIIIPKTRSVLKIVPLDMQMVTFPKQR